MPRLFTGLELPPDVVSDLAATCGHLSGARWIDEDDYHITLRFIGDVGEDFANEAHSSLGLIGRAPFKVTLASLNAFGGGRPRAIIATIKPAPALLQLQAEQERLMRRLGLAAETRKYTPHVTLARLRGTSAANVAEYLSLHGYFASREFEVDHVCLFSARDSVGGGPYIVEARYPLVGPAR